MKLTKHALLLHNNYCKLKPELMINLSLVRKKLTGKMF